MKHHLVDEVMDKIGYIQPHYRNVVRRDIERMTIPTLEAVLGRMR